MVIVCAHDSGSYFGFLLYGPCVADMARLICEHLCAKNEIIFVSIYVPKRYREQFHISQSTPTYMN